MANEAQVRVSLEINKTTSPASTTVPFQHRSFPTGFRATITGAKGPTPGAFTAAMEGTDVDLSELVVPGFCILQNLDATNYVEYGIWDGVSFYPLGKLLAGEINLIRLSSNLGQEYGTAPGTGTTGAAVNTLRIKANGAPCNVRVDAFEA